MSYKLHFVYYMTLAVFIVYLTSGETDGDPKGNTIIIPPPPCIQFSKLRTAEIFSSSNIIIYANIYIYMYCVHKRKHKTCLYLLR